MARHLRNMLGFVGRSRLAKRLELSFVFLVTVFTASLVVNEAILPLSRRLLPFIDPNLSIVQIHLTWVLIIATCAIFSGAILIVLRALVPRVHNFIFGSMGEKLAPITYAFALIFAFALPFGILLAYDSKTKILANFLEHYGSWLAVFGLVLSVSGLHFSALAMQDLRHVLNTFEDFKIRFSSMLKDIARDPDSTDYVRIMAYTPLPGALALTVEDYDALRDLIFAKESRVEVVCLDEDSLEMWMGRFRGKNTRSGRRLEDAAIIQSIGEVDDLVWNLDHPNLRARRGFASEHPVVRGQMSELPRFYAYFTSYRALVINPLYFPVDTLSANMQPEELRNRYVELIGFETTDTYTLKNLHNTYELVRSQVRERKERERLEEERLERVRLEEERLEKE